MSTRTVRPPIDETAFAALLQVARPRALLLLRRLCGADAEDVLQETLAKVWRLRASFDPRRGDESWLLQAAFRTFCDHRQRQRRRPQSEADVGLTAAPRLACPVELKDEVRHRLLALSPIERDLLLGFHRDGLSLQELATQHALPRNTIKSHLRRARLRLQEDA